MHKGHTPPSLFPSNWKVEWMIFWEDQSLAAWVHVFSGSWWLPLSKSARDCLLQSYHRWCQWLSQHQLSVFFYWNGELNEMKQLFLHQLFPATTKHPETVFTGEVLDNFDVHHCTSIMSVDSFCTALQKMSGAKLPNHVLVGVPSWHCDCDSS